mgnify:FL=1
MNYKLELINLLQDISDWESLKRKLEDSYNTSLQKDGNKSTLAGKLFEYFAKYYFICHPLYQNEFNNVWLFDEIPLDVKKSLNINHIDHGIDLVLKDKNNSYIAVQCKFKNDENSKLGWSKDKLGNLFGFASSIDKLIIFSNASEIDDVSKTRTDNLCFLSIKDLLELDADFFNNIREYLQNNTRISYKKVKPFAYQTKIINTVSTYFSAHDRGKLILPCGTGKTLISLWIKESLDVHLTLFLVPSLNLIRQTKNEWIKNSKAPFEYIIVCSEMDIDNEQDSSNIRLYDLDSFVTDKICEIKNFIKKETSNKKIIFSTYQSFKKIIDAYDENLPPIDFAICDEAHRTASIDFGVFSLIHNDTEKMCIKKRLYMTATPRVYSRTIKKNIEEAGSLLFDMSDENVYGKEIYRMTFAKAISLGILVDYQIICLGVSDENIYNLLKDNIYIANSNSINDFVNNYAVKISFAKYPISHAISFHSKVKQAQLFSERNEKLCNTMNSYFVSGNHTATKRSLILNAFKTSEKAIVSNARCLTEGVDIPSVDAVFFCDPKNSKVDIVQAVGRALRKDKNNTDKIGRIIIPLYFSKNSDIENEIDASIYSNVIKIIRSIADQDERLQDEINTIAYKQPANKTGNSKIQFYYEENSKLSDLLAFENIGKKIEDALFGEIISKNSTTWELYYKELSDYLIAHNNIYPKQQDSMRLYTWCTQQRTAYTKNTLPTDKIKKMEALHFSWNVQNDLWNETFEKLVEFLKENNNRWPRQRNTTGLEHSLAVWMMKVDKEQREGVLKKERYDKLVSIGYIFENRKWVECFENAKTIIEKIGHFPNQDEDTNVYSWLLLQQRKYNSGKLTQNKKELLDKIHIQNLNFGDINADVWEERFQYLKDEYEKNGKLPAYSEKFGYKRKIAFGTWATHQRLAYKNGKLSSEQKSKLESIGFIFDTDNKWEEKFELLKHWVETHNGLFPNNPLSKDEVERTVSVFCAYNRNWFNGKLNGKLKTYGDFPVERKEKLDSIGFEWNPDTNDNKWNEKFEMAKKQIKKYGNIPWKIDGKMNSIYRWLSNQKVAFRNNKLSAERIKKLKEIGIELEK